MLILPKRMRGSSFSEVFPSMLYFRTVVSNVCSSDIPFPDFASAALVLCSVAVT